MPRSPIGCLVLALLVLAALTPAIPVSAQSQPVPTAPAPDGALVFPETGQWLAGAFKQYWEANGALARFGYPISPPLRDGNGRTIQWLERARFEYHGHLPQGQRVLLGLLAREVAKGREGEPAFAHVSDPGDGTWFQETGHTLRGGFRARWEADGGLPVYGFPISEEFVERNPADGKEYVVQYFERNRFEYHPEHAGTPHEIQFGLLGRQLYTGGGIVVAAVPDDTPPPPPLSVEEVEQRVGPLRHRLPTLADLEEIGVTGVELRDTAEELKNGCLVINRQAGNGIVALIGICPSVAIAQNYLNGIVIGWEAAGGAGRFISGPWDAGVIAQRRWTSGPISVATGTVAFRQGTTIGGAVVNGVAPINLDRAETLALVIARQR